MAKKKKCFVCKKELRAGDGVYVKLREQQVRTCRECGTRLQRQKIKEK